MLQTLTLLALAVSLNTTAAPTRGRATVRRGKATTTAWANGNQVRVRTRTARGTPVDMKLDLGATCDANKVAQVMAKEVSANTRVFRGPGGRGTIHVGLSPTEVQQVETALVAILSAGKHGVEGRRGFTRFAPVNVKLGTLPRAGRSKTIGGRGRGGSTKVTSLVGGGVSVTRTGNLPGGVEDVLEVTFGPDGGMSWVRSLSFGTGEGRVTVSQGSERDDAGSEGGGFAKVAKGNGILFDGGVGGSGSGQKQQTGGGGGDESGSDQSSGGGGGEDSGESTSSPSMTSDGTVTAPAFDLSDAFVGNVINWNRLGGAVTQPAPHRDEEGEPGEQDSGKKMSPCGQLDDKDFDPNPAYLRPNKQGWVTDPVPFLRGSSPSRGRDR